MPKSRIFYLADMSFNAIRENKILVKISGFTVNARNHDEAAHNERSHMGLSLAIRGDLANNMNQLLQCTRRFLHILYNLKHAKPIKAYNVSWDFTSVGKHCIHRVNKGAKIRSTTPYPGYHWESDKPTVRHHKREPRGQPFPSR